MPATIERPGGTEQQHTIKLAMDLGILVDNHGRILGPSAEGTLGIILYAGHPQYLRGDRFEVEKAIRLPRLLQSDLMLNYHVAEIGYHEGKQAVRFPQKTGVLGASNFYRLEEANVFTGIPETGEGPCFIGFYLSPLHDYKLCLVSRERAWPEDFAATVDSEKLFVALEEQCRQGRGRNGFSDLLFIPDPSAAPQSAQPAGVLNPVTQQYFDLSMDKDLAGWWFNLPVAVYPWMTTNLERLLTGMLEDEGGSETTVREKLRGWDLHNWLVLIKQLTIGLYEIHRLKAVHGDPRPANIMADTPRGEALTPESFRWIDVGLGFDAQEETGDGPGEPQRRTPRPLGGNRSSVFYAPERNEGNEFEDADAAHLESFDDGLMKLKLFWRERTNHEHRPMQLKDKHMAVKALGELTRGDRVQVREFVFDVEGVEPDGLIVSRVYELKLDRVLIEKTGTDLKAVMTRLNHAPISRYKIYYEWSQASDIYSMGVIVLYFFFIRGLYKSMETEACDFSGREVLFEELVGVLRNRSFLDIFIQGLRNSELGPEEILAPSLHDRLNTEKIDDIVGILFVADTNFYYVLRGLDDDYALFLQVIYFTLCCVWRQREVKDIIQKSKFAFEPFANARQFDRDNPSKAAESARHFIEDIIKLHGNSAFRQAHAEHIRVNPDLGKTHIVQMLAMKKELQEKTKKLERAELKSAAIETLLESALNLTESGRSGLILKLLGKDKLLAQLKNLLHQIAEQMLHKGDRP